ncbi:MAG: hypothetical protein IKW06_03750 [Clostridia bacterium]|nr:hypothetical protein [Clostridia bacterium]
MKTKRMIALLLAIATALTLAACAGKVNDADSEVLDKEQQVEEMVEIDKETEEDVKEEEKSPETEKPSEKPTQKPAEKPAETPAPAPESTPSEKPQEQAKTVGQKLLADFNQKAASYTGAEALANAIVTNPIIPFSGATMAVEPGLLSGFGNAEINGFKEGAMFGPVIGSVPFIGYVFVLEDGTDASGFIATLKANADLRWNICVEAEEMVAGSAGNKVFFVMCPKEFSEE